MNQRKTWQPAFRQCSVYSTSVLQIPLNLVRRKAMLHLETNVKIQARPAGSDSVQTNRTSNYPFVLFIIQLFRERLSGKVHATILKGIVGGFEFSFFQRNLKELARKAMEMCLRVLKESNKSRFDSYSRQEQCIDHIPYYLSGLSRAHVFRQTFSK